MLRSKALLAISVIVLVVLAYPVGGFAAGSSVPSLDDLKQMTVGPEAQSEAEIPSIRRQAIIEVAVSLGARSGLLCRAQELLDEVRKNESAFDMTFDFTALVLQGGVMPPVIDEGRNAVVQEEPDMIRTADRIYKVVRPERFVIVVPTWRDYLYVGLMGLTPAERPHDAIIPKNEAERAVWGGSLEKGWATGVKQADEIYLENMARLKRDFEGMVRYRLLLAKGMVTPPRLASSHAVAKGDKREMTVNDSVHVITEHGGLETNAKRWRPVVGGTK